MAEEPRRSGRATKGQHKNLDLISEPPPKKTKAKGQSKEKVTKPSIEPTPAPSEEEEIIRCICGEYEEEEDVERDMICCDKCSAWQHNDCMGLTFVKGEEPAEYFCEICRPENHKVLLDQISHGEKPWEEVAKKRLQEIEEKKAARRRKGKKGKRGARTSDLKLETNVEAVPTVKTPPPPASPPHVQDTKPEPPPDSPSTSAQKRKFEEHQENGMPEVGPKPKQQKTSTQGPEVTEVELLSPEPSQRAATGGPGPQQGSVVARATSEVAGTPEEIVNPARRSCASALVKLFVEQIDDAQKQGIYKLPEGKLVDDVARQLGLAIEHAMYLNICGGSGEPNEPYKSQLRTVLFNVKKNPSLRDRLLVGSLSPNALSTMSTQDMASEELQQKDAEIKREAEKQHIIVQEQGPRIRRTHKGEELVEDDNQAISSESIFSTAPAHRAADSEGHATGSPAARSVSPRVQHQPEFGDSEPAGKPLIDTESFAEGADKTDTANFNNQSTWSNVQSPGGTIHDRPFPEAPANFLQPLPTGKVQVDEEIDQLLKDEEADSSPPYSPKDYQSDGFIWHGRVCMNPVAEFASSARHVGGADLSGRIPWSQLIPPMLLIDGRIDIQLASNYLCGLRFSSSTDVSVISMTAPESPVERVRFDRLFNYFVERKRYGVIGKHPLPAVKDTYIIPIEAGSSKKPEFIELLENNTIEDPVPTRILLVVFVVKTSEHGSTTPSTQPTPQHLIQDFSITAASPLTATPVSQQPSQYMTMGKRSGSQPSPPPPTGLGGTPPMHAPFTNSVQQPPVQQIAYSGNQLLQYQPPSPQQASPTGHPVAARILGPHAKSPAIEQLLKNAPNADAAQLNVVRDILDRNPVAANDYQVLMQAIVQATNSQSTG